jgi:hypothetical protein
VFGRRKTEDEDPFAALKEGGTYQSPPPTVTTKTAFGPQQPPASPPPATAPAPSWTPPPVTQRFRHWGGRSGLGLMIGARLVFAVIIAAVAIGVPLLATTHTSHSTFSVPFIGAPPGGGNGSRTAPHIVPLSYLTPGGVRAALRYVEKVAPHARVSLVRLDAHSFSASASLPHGVVKEIYAGPTGTFVTTGPSNAQHTVPISSIRPGVIGGLVAEMRHRFHAPSGRIDYIVLSSPPALVPHWIIFTKDPSHTGYSASMRGGGLTKLA